MRLTDVQRIAMGAIWLSLGLLKLTAPGVLAAHLADLFRLAPSVSDAVAIAIILLECGAGGALLVGKPSGYQAVLIKATTLVAGCILLFLLFSPPQETACGCFGSVARADTAIRIAVAAILVFLGTSILADRSDTSAA